LEAVAAGSGLLHTRSSTVDLEKSDVLLTLQGLVNGTYNPCVKVQVKTVDGPLALVDDDHYTYPLDVETYDVLRRTDHSVRRILAVIGLSGTTERVRLEQAGTLLVGRGAWVSLEGEGPTANKSTIAVPLPVANTIDTDGLHAMLTTYGVPRSTPVPPLDTESAWEDSP
jgi:hypothetical protein